MKNNSLTVGIFVVVSVVIGIAAVLALGAKDALAEKNRYVMFFEGDMTGLGPGAPVVFRGVKIGAVSDVKIIVDKDMNARVPVFVELSATPSENGNGKLDREEAIHKYLKRGMCGKLATESFVTGKLMIQLDFDTEKKKYTQPHKGKEIVIPTVSSDLELLKESLTELPIKSMVETLVRSLEGIDKRVNSVEVTDSLKHMSASMKNLEVLLGNANKEIVRLGARSDTTLDQAQTLMKSLDVSVKKLTVSLNETIGGVNKLAGSLNTQVNDVGGEVKLTTASANKTIKELEKTLAQYRAMIDVDSPIYIGLIDAVNNFSKASESITAFSEYLNRHPESLIRGKKGN